MKKITIIGSGVMGTIFLEALIKKYTISITDHDPEKLLLLKRKFPKARVLADNSLAVNNTDVVILAVKPQSFSGLAKELKGKISQKTIVLSIMAGVNIKRIQKELGAQKVVRAMPNLGARVGKSMTVWTSSKFINLFETKKIVAVLSCIGDEMFVKSEAVINKATAVSGSGPGFYFYFVEVWLKAIENLGFSNVQAKKLLFKTIEGSGILLSQDGDPAKLRIQVASKGGTTEAGLVVLMNDDGLSKILDKTLKMAEKRAKELSS